MKKRQDEFTEEINNQSSVEEDMIPQEKEDLPSDLILALNLLLDDKNIKGKTILNNRQVTAITLMNWAGQVYNIPFLTDFVAEWCRYRISGDNGKGRDDLIKIAQAIQLQQQEQQERALDLLRIKR